MFFLGQGGWQEEVRAVSDTVVQLLFFFFLNKSDFKLHTVIR